MISPDALLAQPAGAGPCRRDGARAPGDRRQDEAAARKEAQLPGDSAAYAQALEEMNRLQTEEPMAR
ncbi:hypothetical protein DFR48_1024 [Ciceribacter lividus]|uniref:Uncharacterized protein n=1 Tax=Ciceribacter lividus TaxID=1197950 RepID=A0A6I7HP49_9HYPH|nr:hypothetical protein DFR48_1024 [Ciceribacter lividus]